MANSKNCIRFETCKFVEKNTQFVNQMYPMFEYSESNNLNELFFKNAAASVKKKGAAFVIIQEQLK